MSPDILQTEMPSCVVSFGVFEFQIGARELRKDGRPLRIDPQAASLLAILLEEPGGLVSYEKIQQRLWSGTFVDYGNGIRRCLAQLRAALGDDADKPIYIETERGIGCRFIAPVRISISEPDPPPAQAIRSDPAHSDAQNGNERPAPLSPDQPVDRAPAENSGVPSATPSPEKPVGGALVWLWRTATAGMALAVAAVLITAVLAPAYGLAIPAFCVGAAFAILIYNRFESTPGARAVLAGYMIAGMAYIASGTTMPDFQNAIVNVTTLPPAAAYLFVVGLKFIPLFILALLYWVAIGYYGDAGFSATPVLERAYIVMGLLFLFTEFIFVGLTSSDYQVFKAGVPGRWTLAVGWLAIIGINLAVWVAGRHCFSSGSRSSRRQFFFFCAAAYLGIAVAAFFVDDEHNRINRDYLDLRWPEAYVAENPDGIREFQGSGQAAFRTQIGPDLLAVLNDPGFQDALRHGKFYKQHFDEPFQLRRRAVIYAYRPKLPSGSPRSGFVSIRFPKELADAIRFVPIGGG